MTVHFLTILHLHFSRHLLSVPTHHEASCVPIFAQTVPSARNAFSSFEADLSFVLQDPVQTPSLGPSLTHQVPSWARGSQPPTAHTKHCHLSVSPWATNSLTGAPASLLWTRVVLLPRAKPQRQGRRAMHRSWRQIQETRSQRSWLMHLENNLKELLVENPVSPPPIPIQCRTHPHACTRARARTRIHTHTHTHTMIQRGK